MDINKRISQDIVIEDDLVYIDGLLWTSIILLTDLARLMKEEGRCRGIVISYFNSLESAFSTVDLEDNEIYGTILYLLKPLIILEYKKLRRRKVSRADCLIILVKKFLELLESFEDYTYNKQIVTALKIIGRLFDNIKNPGKNLNLSPMIETIKSFIARGVTGKYSLNDFSIDQEENKLTENNEISGSGIKIEDENRIEEVTWKEE